MPNCKIYLEDEKICKTCKENYINLNGLCE